VDLKFDIIKIISGQVGGFSSVNLQEKQWGGW